MALKEVTSGRIPPTLSLMTFFCKELNGDIEQFIPLQTDGG